jgi:GNAT superfamily N-acetyltransferase
MNQERAFEINQNDICIRPVQLEDRSGVVRVLNQVYGSWGNLQDWIWKYQSPPVQFHVDSVLAEYKGKIIGHYGLLPIEAAWGDQSVPVAQGIDAGVLPEYRRSGVYTALANEVLRRAGEAGVKFIYAFPGLLSLRINLEHGYRSTSFVPEMICVLDVKRAIWLSWRFLAKDINAYWNTRKHRKWSPDTVSRLVRLRRGLFFLASVFSAPSATFQKKLSNSKVKIYPVEQNDNRFDTLWTRSRGTTSFGLSKGSKYFGWRYYTHPSRAYHIFVAQNGHQWVGCLVMRHTGLRSEITELMVDPNYAESLSDLLITATSQARRAGSVVMSIWANAWNPYLADLRRQGFASPLNLFKLAGSWPPLSRQLYQMIIYIKHLSLEKQSLFSTLARSWNFSMGDSDLV